ncbi:MAG TPA: isochorismatase family cysteine hydrolase [Candidatus Micrarchaeia archaeon]|nr:isochorismatase family cysteine hydrolase [Candidatus Micrarchaeia archaeon]
MIELGQFDEEAILAEAEAQYATDDPAATLDAAHAALIVVDMIDEFVRPRWSPYWIPEATRQVPRVGRVAAAFRAARRPVVYLAYEVGLRGLNFPTPAVPIGAAARSYADRIFQRVAICPDLAPGPDDLVVLKHTYSGFHGTALDAVLRGLEVDTVVICGTMTNFCCGATAREAYWHGYQVVFGSDINSTDDPELHVAELRTLRRGYARIATAADILEGLPSPGPTPP